MRIPFASQSYQTGAIHAERLVNWYPEVEPPNAKTPVALLGVPGLKLYQTVGQGPIRGAIRMEGDAYVVSGNNLYRVLSNGTASLLGSIPGVGQTPMAHNGTQVAVLAGTEASDLYIATVSTLTQCTDVNFPGATSVDFIAGYFIFSRTGTGQFFISQSYDGLTFDAADFATAEGDPDNLVRVLEDHGEVWLFGEKSTEVWYNSGAADFPFERASGAGLERGCIAPFSIAKLDNTIFWVGDDRIVYRAEGYTPKRVSTHGVEAILERHLGLGDLRAFAYTQGGHAFYVLKKPGEFTLVYDANTKRWHERQSYQRNDWRPSCYIEAFNRRLVGDDLTGNIYELDPDTHTENGDPIVMTAVGPNLWAEAETATMNSLVLDIEGGVGLTSGQGSDPQVMLRMSKDGGKTWGPQMWRSLGAKGDYRRQVRYDRLGQFRQLVLEVSISDPVKRVVMGAYAEIEGGTL